MTDTKDGKFKVALRPNPSESQVFFNDEPIEGIKSITVTQGANEVLEMTLEITGPTIDQVSILVGAATIRTICPRCNNRQQHMCRGDD